MTLEKQSIGKMFEKRQKKVLSEINAMPIRGRNIILGEVLSIHPTTVSQLVHGSKTLSARTLIILEDYF
jgi:plasmid maintenance system antidote protein VapI